MGAVVRRAGAADVDRLIALCAEVFDESDAQALRFDLEREGPEQFVIAVDGDRVVSSLGLLSRSLRVSGVALPVGVVEYVMTLPEYRRRGLVRAQMETVHQWSAERGDLLQLIVGIPYLYRRFGYGYALPHGPRHQLRRAADTTMPDGWTARTAAPGDEDALAAIHEAAQAAADVALARPAEEWAFMVRSLQDRDESLIVVEHGGAIGGYALAWEAEARSFVVEAGASSLAAARAVLAASVSRVGPMGFSINDRPGTPVSTLLLDAGIPLDRPYDVFARVPDVVALLQRLRPVLSARMADSDFAAETGDVRLSTYTAGARIRYAAGEVVDVSAAEPVEEPEPGMLAVPPDLLPGLVLGAWDPLELEASHRDVDFWYRRALARTLFPKLVADAIWAY